CTRWRRSRCSTRRRRSAIRPRPGRSAMGTPAAGRRWAVPRPPTRWGPTRGSPRSRRGASSRTTASGPGRDAAPREADGSPRRGREDDGVALREQAWGQYKKKIDRWFWWEATYYDDFQAGLGEVDLFASANTFGTTKADPAYGQAGGANGNGLFMYPGTDTKFP